MKKAEYFDKILSIYNWHRTGARLTIAELSYESDISKSRVQRYVHLMVKEGILKRSNDKCQHCDKNTFTYRRAKPL